MKKLLALIIGLFVFTACARVNNSVQKEFGDDSNYFLALQASDNGNENEALRLFKIARKKGTPLIAKRSAEALTMLGSVKERVESSLYLAKNYDDESSLAIACRELLQHEEYVSIINLTEKLALDSAKNEIIRYRLESLAQKRDSRFDSEFFTWFISRPVSADHIEVYQTYLMLLDEKNRNIGQESEKFQKNLNKRSLLESQLAPIQDEKTADVAEPSIIPEGGFETLLDALQEAENPEKSIIDYRISVYHRSYIPAYKQIDKIFRIFENRGEEINRQLLSDIGKATLYGTNDYFASARDFDRLAEKLSREKAYYAYFYAARLYDKAGRYPTQTASRFRKALESTDDPVQFDNCLWYLLNFQLRGSTDDIISTLTQYGSQIHDATYFDDFFEQLSILLLSSHRWQDFYKVWKQTNSNFSDYTVGKYAYISGRLLEESMAKGDEDLRTRQAFEAYTKVLNNPSSIYYKVCALERLNVSDPELVKSYIFKKGIPTAPVEDNGAGRLLAGYAAFGFPQRMYPAWLANRKNLTIEDSIAASKFLSKCAQNSKDVNYNIQSLRIASRCFGAAEGETPKELVELSFPRFYKEIIDNACKEFGIPDYLVFALVRSESFFDASVTSKAGAFGLTQLMEGTANDEARKLKIGDNFDIFDPKTNVRMGTHYLASMIERSEENNELLALYAYNAGLTNVRNWARTFRNDWSTTGRPAHKPVGISMDLFLESLPFAETREYGRKVIAAAAMYAYLYEGKLPGDTVREIMY